MTLLHLTDERPDAEIKKALDAVIADALTAWSPLPYEGYYPRNGFGITDLRPKHVNVGAGTTWGSSNYWAASHAASNTFGDWMNFTLTNQAYVIQTGVFNREAVPKTYDMVPQANGEKLPVINIEALYTLDVARAWYSKPYAIKANNNLTIRLKAENTGVERIGLLGVCLAKRAFLIEE